MRFRALMIGAAAVVTSPASAQSTVNYFECRVTTPGQESAYRVTTDEGRGQVTYEVLGNGNVFTKPATFTPDSVMWGDAGSQVSRLQFTISRIDLSFDVSLSIGGKVLQPRKGNCIKLATPKRAF